MTWTHYRKALHAAAWAALAALGAAALDGALTTTEAIAAAGVGLVTGFGTARSRPNTPNSRAV